MMSALGLEEEEDTESPWDSEVLSIKPISLSYYFHSVISFPVLASVASPLQDWTELPSCSFTVGWICRFCKNGMQCFYYIRNCLVRFVNNLLIANPLFRMKLQLCKASQELSSTAFCRYRICQSEIILERCIISHILKTTNEGDSTVFLHQSFLFLYFSYSQEICPTSALLQCKPIASCVALWTKKEQFFSISLWKPLKYFKIVQNFLMLNFQNFITFGYSVSNIELFSLLPRCC